MKNQLQFFAAMGDLAPVLADIDGENPPLTYWRFGRGRIRAPAGLGSGPELPMLGLASAGATIQCDAYLVQARIAVAVREIPGTGEFAVDQLVNPDSVVLIPGGEWERDFVISGQVSTASDSADAKALLRRFAKGIQKQFDKVKAFYVGSRAMQHLKNGSRRLVTATQSPPQYDLQL